MANLAIIPARGGSKRIAGKNIKNFLGKPIISYSIEAALQSNLFDEVMVSTDDKKIAEVATQYGAKIPFFRSKKTADDYATLADVILEVVDEYNRKGKNFDNICCILPTAPFLNSKRIKEGYELLNNNNFYSVFPVLEFSYPIQRSLIKNQDGSVKMAYPEHLNARSQDLEKHYHDSGQFYWIKTAIFIKEKTLFASKSGIIELSQLEVQDIDTLDDWRNAEEKYQIIHGK
jgi:N-acylneuraminate cytidylyltransferase